MPDRSTLVTERAAAGAAYAAAAAGYVEAWIELNAYDACVSNSNVSPDGAEVSRFHNSPEVLKHPDFLPSEVRNALVSPNRIGPLSSARADRLIASARRPAP